MWSKSQQLAAASLWAPLSCVMRHGTILTETVRASPIWRGNGAHMLMSIVLVSMGSQHVVACRSVITAEVTNRITKRKDVRGYIKLQFRCRGVWCGIVDIATSVNNEFTEKGGSCYLEVEVAEEWIFLAAKSAWVTSHHPYCNYVEIPELHSISHSISHFCFVSWTCCSCFGRFLISKYPTASWNKLFNLAVIIGKIEIAFSCYTCIWITPIKC